MNGKMREQISFTKRRWCWLVYIYMDMKANTLRHNEANRVVTKYFRKDMRTEMQGSAVVLSGSKTSPRNRDKKRTETCQKVTSRDELRNHFV
jgi:hypothetical protein